jgi:protein-disulfide isomerase
MIVVFSDFECQYCALLHPILDSILEQNPTEVSLVYRHFPLSVLHAMATPAAIASECAGLVGRFWEFHDALFRTPSLVSGGEWSAAASQAGIADRDAFSECMTDNDSVDQYVKDDIAAATQLGLNGTPALLLNSRLIRGLPPTPHLTAMIEEALAGTGPR